MAGSAPFTDHLMARRIEVWPVERLVPYERNARTHSPEQVAKIARSIERFGFLNPILVDGEAGIIAGHGRLMAARELAWREVPVVVVDHLSDEERRAYVLADNRLAELADWDADFLVDELEDLRLEDFDLGLLGWSDAELEDLLDKPGAFAPGTKDEQGKLDEREEGEKESEGEGEPEEIDVVCPKCGHEFVRQV